MERAKSKKKEEEEGEKKKNGAVQKFLSLFRSKKLAGVDQAGNRYCYREPRGGEDHEKRWVEFKSDHDPTAIPVEWATWLHGWRREAPTQEEIMQMEAHRELVKTKIAKMEEEKKKESEETSLGQETGSGSISLVNSYGSSS